MQVDPRRTMRQDTFDLRDQIAHDEDGRGNVHLEAANYTSTDEEEHSVLESDSEGEENEEEFIDDDGSSSLSIPNESIDFDLVYSLHSFAATVEGQANVVKGDSLFLMDDSNSYWWLVRVLKTQEVGYIPAENIETPFERLARLNKHRNVDLASATQAELQSDLSRIRSVLAPQGSQPSPASPTNAPNAPRTGNTVRNPLNKRRTLCFSAELDVHRYPPAVWNEEEWLIEREERRAAAGADYDGSDYGEDDDGDGEWDVGNYESEDRELAEEEVVMRRISEASLAQDMDVGGPPREPVPKLVPPSEPDDGMSWESGGVSMQQGEEALSAQESQLRKTGSMERITSDLAEITETRKVTVTPSIAREPVSPVDNEQELESRKRQRDEDEEVARKRVAAKPEVKSNATPMGAPVSSTSTQAKAASPVSGGKLRKLQEPLDDDKDGKKKKGGVFGSLFRKSSKEKEKGKTPSIGSENDLNIRASEDSGRRPSSSNAGDGLMSPTTAVAMQQQQQQQATSLRNSTDPKRIQQMIQQQQPQGSPQAASAASQLRQRDQQQQALYQQYLNRSPSSPPEQPSYGLQSASAYMGSSSMSVAPSSFSSPSSGRQRPGSLILTPSDGVGVPELSVIRVFAGHGLQTDATFKTVLLNTSTTSADLVRQAVQRFRLEDLDMSDYFLTVKQMEGSSAVLRDEEHPLVVFEGLVESAPRVKRSSVGSVSSVASNLSMHPAIKKLDMNDFTDDSVVKFYLNRRNAGDTTVDSIDAADDTLVAETVDGDDSQRYLTVSTTAGTNVQPERFTSPSIRFALQLVIFPEDLPDDMLFDPLTEAIVFKHTLRDRGRPSINSPGVSQSLRRKVFVFPKNVTVAEVIEMGLERFGIEEGVVDGGDEIEDKLSKRRSAIRVRYGLAVDLGNGKERELSPSSRVIDAFSRPPSFRSPQTQFQNKRRSVDSAQMLGTVEDVGADDPIFILRRATAYRSSAASRHRVSGGLDEIALQKLHRDSVDGNTISGSSAKDIIAAQRAAMKATQDRILSASTSERSETSRRQPSVTSLVLDDVSGHVSPAKLTQKRVAIPHDDFGVSHMMAIISLRGSVSRKPLAPLDTVDELLFGRPMDVTSLHPKIRSIYADAAKDLDDIDKLLDRYIYN
ncbi:unnamed protein product [Mycena citricolor]|uniref:SH3 domain-containing protein n=1 Tax=Mycena citricolor TaxID=2018698 RepID=A0AAD2GZL3_9AGAR|nr:unnamed protein product [Mycena citricolor]CAK5281471.1 unnamed protein product [Mycena citricolor]